MSLTEYPPRLGGGRLPGVDDNPSILLPHVRRAFGMGLALSRSILVFLVVGSVSHAAELPTPEQIVAQAGKACDSSYPSAESGRLRGLQDRLERGLRDRAWQKLASARARLGDFDGAAEALNHLNADPRFSEVAVQAMRTELTGIVAPWPENLPRKLKETQKSVLADILRKQGRFEPALEIAHDIADDQSRAWSTAQIYLTRARSLEETDRITTLKDQNQALELANTIRDANHVREIQNEVCRGQIRIGPPEAARILFEVFTFKLKEAEQATARSALVQEWLRFGEFYLLTRDDAGAEQCFKHARDLFATTSRGKTWKESLPHQLALHYRCRAYRETGRLTLIPDVLAEWERAFSKLTDPKDVAFVAPFLIRHQIEADRFDEASTTIQALDVPTTGSVIQQAAEEIQKSASPAQKKTFAAFVKTLLPEPEEMHLSMLVVAAELLDSAGDRESADASIDEAQKIADERKKEYRSFIAGWLAENGRFEKAYRLIEAIDDPKQQAQALSELAFQITRPKQRDP
jgi:tetratricopeptide (TPR) repeat protein